MYVAFFRFFLFLFFFLEIRCNIFIPLYVNILADPKNSDITISFERGIWNICGNYKGISLWASSENLLADIVVQGRKTSGRKRLLTIPVAQTINGEIQRTAERHIHSFCYHIEWCIYVAVLLWLVYKKIKHTYSIAVRFRYDFDLFDLRRLLPIPWQLCS